ncbi:hypothetical protein ARD30_16355 [Bosea thiooxidans]|uniref:Uncharacterized protein n=1 Tax=Bosea thiooxidans TaxID=53254 RepID=A0A0Q3SXP0_9HYPH|nr:hypothetical protein [Bosea thiooxidans]KQK30018.1 hypothetical protein ARD30_16355 [Bosea thiooxidans]
MPHLIGSGPPLQAQIGDFRSFLFECGDIPAKIGSDFGGILPWHTGPIESGLPSLFVGFAELGHFWH